MGHIVKKKQTQSNLTQNKQGSGQSSKKASSADTQKAGGSAAAPAKKKNPASTQKEKKSLAFKGVKTYQEMDPIDENLGESVAKLSLTSEAHRNPAANSVDMQDVKQGGKVVRKGILDSDGDLKEEEDDNFNDIWRKAIDGHDEFLSTAFVRNFLKGFLKHRPWEDMALSERDHFKNLVNQISEVRMPTEFVGATSPLSPGSADLWKVQHPTGLLKGTKLSKGIFLDHKLTSSQHNYVDRVRRMEVEAAMQSAINDGAKTAQEVISAGIRVGISSTLGRMAAPITASNVLPHTTLQGKSLSDPSLTKPYNLREHMKTIFDRHNAPAPAAVSNAANNPLGPKIKATQPINANWDREKFIATRSVSPFRSQAPANITPSPLGKIGKVVVQDVKAVAQKVEAAVADVTDAAVAVV